MVEQLPGTVEVSGVSRDHSFRPGHVPAEPLLLLLQQVERYCAGVMSLKQLAALGLQLCQLLVRCDDQTGSLLASCLEFHKQLPVATSQGTHRQLHGQVYTGNLSLNAVNQLMVVLAAILALPAEAIEVGIDTTMPMGQRQTQPASAVGTEDAALEVVLMLSLPLSSRAPVI